MAKLTKQECIDWLQQAVNGEPLYNVDFAAIKDRLTYLFDSEYRERSKVRAGKGPTKAFGYELEGSRHLHLANSKKQAKNLKLAEAALKSYGRPDEAGEGEVQLMRWVITEWASVADLIKQVKPLVIKARKPRPDSEKKPRTARSATHNGTCPMCGKQHAVSKVDGTLASHGYTLSYGFQDGECGGSRKLPVEVSREPAEASIVELEAFATELRDNLAKNPERKNIFDDREWRLRGLESHIKYIAKLIETRHGKPLPERPE